MTDVDLDLVNKKKYNLRSKTTKDTEKPNAKKEKKPKDLKKPKKIVKEIKVSNASRISKKKESEQSDIDIENTDDESDSEEEANEYTEDSFIDNREVDDDDNKKLIVLLTNAISKKISESMVDEEDSDEYSEQNSDQTSENSDQSDVESECKPKQSKSQKKDQKNDQKLYKKIKDDLKKDKPSVKKLLQSDVPFKEQCYLFEQIKVLENMNKYTEEYVFLKNRINEKLNGYVKSNLNKKQYGDYDKIESELLKDKDLNVPLKYKILSSKLNHENKQIVYEKYLLFKDMHPDDNNYAKLSEWFEWALSIPTETKQLKILNTNEDRNRFSNELKDKLDETLYGIDNVKEQIRCTVNDYLTLFSDDKNKNNSKLTGNQLALVGSPGVGKTLLIRTLAKCLDIPFQQISLGGVKDSSFLEGHSYTYEGAKPGVIVEAMRRMKFTNGIIFFDEFDKLGDSDKGLEVANSLLHIIDTTQNEIFRDKYLSELGVDLSKIWFIYSMNDDSLVNGILRDRVKPVIRVADYKETDKIQIVHRHLLPSALKVYGYTKDNIDIEDETIIYLINKIDKEKGVRELKQAIKMVVCKIHFLKTNILKDGTLGNIKVKFNFLDKVDINKKIMITKEIIDICLLDLKKEESINSYMYI